MMDLLTPPPEWVDQAACAGITAGDPWHPGDGGDPEPAKTICRTCPMWAACLTYGMTDPEGVYGGYTAWERRAIRLGHRCQDCGALRTTSARLCRTCANRARRARHEEAAA